MAAGANFKDLKHSDAANLVQTLSEMKTADSHRAGGDTGSYSVKYNEEMEV